MDFNNRYDLGKTGVICYFSVIFTFILEKLEMLEIKKQKRQGLKVDAKVEPRYPLDRRFTFGETVFIGNRADYARQALGSPNSSIVPYLAELEKVVDFVFGGSMNQPDVRVAESQVLFKGTEPGRNAPALGSKYKKL